MHTNNLVPTGGEAVTASDSTQARYVGLYVGTGGNVAVTTGLGAALTFSNVPAGAIIPMVITQVKATGTTASNIVGFLA
jgi:hypothetical protein